MDYIGISLLALGVGALQVMLDKGQEDDWFGSRFITTLALISASGLVSLVIWEWRQKEPIIEVRLFKRFNFAVANLMMFILGVILFSSLVMMPQFLQTLVGYTAESAGLVLSASGLADSVRNADCRPTHHQGSREIHHGIRMAGARLRDVLFHQTAGSADQLPVRGVAARDPGFRLGILIRADHPCGYIGVPAEKATGVGPGEFHAQYREQRGNIDGDDTAARRAQFHQSMLSYHTTGSDLAFQNQVSGLSQQLIHTGISPADAQANAYARVYQSMQAQSQTLAYIDTFMVLAIGAGIMFLLTFMVRKNDPATGGEVAAG